MSPDLYSQLGSPRYDKIPNDTPSRLRDPDGGPLNTQLRVYLVAYFPDAANCGVRIVDAYDRQNVSALLALDDKLLLILPPDAQSEKDSCELVNPYEFWEGKTMVTDRGMFFGRKKEEKDALRFLMDKDGRRLIPGRTLLIYGQKRCGKSSFLGKLRKTIRTRDNNAIILDYADIYHTVCEENPEKLPRFPDKFYGAMLDDFMKGIRECRPDIIALADEYPAPYPPL